MPSGRCPLSVPAPIADLMRRGSHALREGYVNGLWGVNGWFSC